MFAIEITVDGQAAEILQGGILDQAQEIFDTGLWWVKNMDNTNQHQLVDISRPDNDAITSPTVQAEQAYVAPTNQSVAWCWNVGTDTGIANTDGTIASTAWVNQTAGFSIVQWTGTGAAGTVGHGLGARPGMVIVKTLDENQNIIVGVDGVTTNNDGGAADAWLTNDVVQVTSWSNAALLNSNVQAGNETSATGLNRNAGAGVTNNMIMYVWAPIENYSAFGSYVGNNDPNNVFVFTNFRPAFVLIKSSASSSDWQIYDTTRNPNNPSSLFLSSNQTLAQTTGFDIDILSNGFKLRSNNGSNGNGECIYAAFAENPLVAPILPLLTHDNYVLQRL